MRERAFYSASNSPTRVAAIQATTLTAATALLPPLSMILYHKELGRLRNSDRSRISGPWHLQLFQQRNINFPIPLFNRYQDPLVPTSPPRYLLANLFHQYWTPTAHPWVNAGSASNRALSSLSSASDRPPRLCTLRNSSSFPSSSPHNSTSSIL